MGRGPASLAQIKGVTLIARQMRTARNPRARCGQCLFWITISRLVPIVCQLAPIGDSLRAPISAKRLCGQQSQPVVCPAAWRALVCIRTRVSE